MGAAFSPPTFVNGHPVGGVFFLLSSRFLYAAIYFCWYRLVATLLHISWLQLPRFAPSTGAGSSLSTSSLSVTTGGPTRVSLVPCRDPGGGHPREEPWSCALENDGAQPPRAQCRVCLSLRGCSAPLSGQSEEMCKPSLCLCLSVRLSCVY